MSLKNESSFERFLHEACNLICYRRQECVYVRFVIPVLKVLHTHTHPHTHCFLFIDST